MGKTVTIYWDHTGPLMQYSQPSGVLHIHDLNPSGEMHWKMSRKELWCIGWRFLRAALSQWW